MIVKEVSNRKEINVLADYIRRHRNDISITIHLDQVARFKPYKFDHIHVYKHEYGFHFVYVEHRKMHIDFIKSTLRDTEGGRQLIDDIINLYFNKYTIPSITIHTVDDLSKIDSAMNATLREFEKARKVGMYRIYDIAYDFCETFEQKYDNANDDFDERPSITSSDLIFINKIVDELLRCRTIEHYVMHGAASGIINVSPKYIDLLSYIPTTESLLMLLKMRNALFNDERLYNMTFNSSIYITKDMCDRNDVVNNARTMVYIKSKDLLCIMNYMDYMELVFDVKRADTSIKFPIILLHPVWNINSMEEVSELNRLLNTFNSNFGFIEYIIRSLNKTKCKKPYIVLKTIF